MPLVFPSPPIPLSTAHAFVAFFTFSYVGSLYATKSVRLSFKNGVSNVGRDGEERTKQSDERWRDDPDVIRARLLAVSMSTLGSVLAVYLLVRSVIPEYEKRRDPMVALDSTLARLGITLEFTGKSSLSIFLPCLVTPVLYFGPIYASYLSEQLPFQRWGTLGEDLQSWIGIRNYLVSPITEEVVFRACVLAVYHMAGASRIMMIFFSPLVFGVAHLHHSWEIYNRYGRTASALRIAMFQTLFQLAYTSLFGFHCAFLYLRTGSLLPPTLSHIFCNYMGLPQYSYQIRMFPKRRHAIRIAYVLGIAGYIYTLRWWTHAEDSLFWPEIGHPGRF